MYLRLESIPKHKRRKRNKDTLPSFLYKPSMGSEHCIKAIFSLPDLEMCNV